MSNQQIEQYMTSWDHLGADIRTARIEALAPVWNKIIEQFRQQGLPMSDILQSLYIALLSMEASGKDWDQAVDLVAQASLKFHSVERLESTDNQTTMCTCHSKS